MDATSKLSESRKGRILSFDVIPYRIVAPADPKHAARRMEAYLEQSKESGRTPLDPTDAEGQTSPQKPDSRLMN